MNDDKRSFNPGYDATDFHNGLPDNYDELPRGWQLWWRFHQIRGIVGGTIVSIVVIVAVIKAIIQNT